MAIVECGALITALINIAIQVDSNPRFPSIYKCDDWSRFKYRQWLPLLFIILAAVIPSLDHPGDNHHPALDNRRSAFVHKLQSAITQWMSYLRQGCPRL
jgi:hypothetical protein